MVLAAENYTISAGQVFGANTGFATGPGSVTATVPVHSSPKTSFRPIGQLVPEVPTSSVQGQERFEYLRRPVSQQSLGSEEGVAPLPADTSGSSGEFRLSSSFEQYTTSHVNFI